MTRVKGWGQCIFVRIKIKMFFKIFCAKFSFDIRKKKEQELYITIYHQRNGQFVLKKTYNPPGYKYLL